MKPYPYERCLTMNSSFFLILALSFSTVLSCKAVKSGQHHPDVPVSSPIIETTAEQNPATPGSNPSTVIPQSETAVQAPPASGAGSVPGTTEAFPRIPEPTVPAAPPPLTNPEALQIFSLRSIPIAQNGLVARQYRIDLSKRSVALDELANDQWKQKLEYRLSDEQLQKVKSLVSTLKVQTYPTCNPCKREVHTILVEAVENNRKALSYAMSEACTCGGNDERKGTIAFANLKQITEILNN